MKSVNHPNLVAVIGVASDFDVHLGVVMDLMPATLFNLLHDRPYIAKYNGPPLLTALGHTFRHILPHLSHSPLVTPIGSHRYRESLSWRASFLAILSDVRRSRTLEPQSDSTRVLSSRRQLVMSRMYVIPCMRR